MYFKQQTIVPGGRYKYGEYYMAAGNVTNKVSSVIYGGDNSTNGGGNTGGGSGSGTDVTDNNFNMYLSITSIIFDGAAMAQGTSITGETRVVGFKGQEQMETYVGVIDQHTTASTSGGEVVYDPPLPDDYGITAVTNGSTATTIPAGMSVEVHNNATTGTTVCIIANSALTYQSGTLFIPCNISMNAMQDLGDDILDWVKAHDEGKTMSVVLEYTWSVSANATSSYRIDLSNDTASVNSDEPSAGDDYNGHVLPGANMVTTTAMTFFGSDPYTAVTYSASTIPSQAATGWTAYTTAGTCVFETIPGTFDFKGDHLDVTFNVWTTSATPKWLGKKTFTIKKSYPSDGKSATSYWMTFSPSNQFKFNPNNNTMTPSAITVDLMMQVGQDTPTAATGCSIWYGFDAPPTSAYTGSIVGDPNYECVNIVARLGNTQAGAIVDGIEQIPILKDGTNGTSGTSVYYLDLNNQSASINCDSSSNILPGAVRPSCKATLYYGSDPYTGSCSYSIVSGSCSYTGVTCDASTGVIHFNTSSETPTFWFDTTKTTLELTVRATIGNINYDAIMNISRSIAGADGRSITGVTEWYALNNDSSNYPTIGTSSWTANTLSNPTSATPFLWNYEEIHYSAGSASTTTPVIIARYTKDGKGISAITEYYAINNSTATTPSTWYTTLQVPTDSNPYLWNKEKITYTDGSTAETTPVIIGIKGGKGSDAVTYWLELDADAVKVSSGGTVTPSSIHISKMKQVGENTPTAATEATINWGFDSTSSLPNTSSTITGFSGHSYVTVKLTVNSVQRDIETIPILYDGQGSSAETRQGPAIRGPYDWYYESEYNIGRKWCNGSGATGTEEAQFLDVIIKDGVYWYCNTSYEESGTTIAPWNSIKGNWTSADTEFDFVAAHILLADNAKISAFTGNLICVMDENNQVTGGLQGTGDTFCWAGSNNPGGAPFKVDYDGNIYAESGTFGGYIQMKYAFVSRLKPDCHLTASTIDVFLSQTNFLGAYEYPNEPEGASGDTYMSWRRQTDSHNNYYTSETWYYYTTYWRQVTNTGSRGYIADKHAYLVSDGCAGSYGMGDGATLVLPAPSQDLNGFIYDILVEANYATRGSMSENPGLAVITVNDNKARANRDRFHIYCFSTGLNGYCSKVLFYGGHVRLVCLPVQHDCEPTADTYAWGIIEATGGFDLCDEYTNNNNYHDGLYRGFSALHGYSIYNGDVNDTRPIYRIQAYKGDPGTKSSDTLYVSRN